jgi:single-strand DNA-binding protein
MASINSITLSGRAGRDPEVRYLDNGTAVANIRLAVDRIGVDRDTGRKKDPLWIDVKIWGKSAQVAADYVRKGSMVGITGRLDEDVWTDKQSGQERRKPIINANDLILLGSRDQGQGQQGDAAGWGGGQASNEEIPF